MGSSEEERRTFSPRANFRVMGASSMTNSSQGRPHLSLMDSFCPPMELAEPCMVWMVVMPPARAVKKAGSSCLMTSAILTSGPPIESLR